MPSFSSHSLSDNFFLAKGIPINADGNGAGNTLRKEFPHAFDGVDLSYVSGPVEVLDLDMLTGLKPGSERKKKKAEWYKNHKRHRSYERRAKKNAHRKRKADLMSCFLYTGIPAKKEEKEKAA